MTEPASWNPHHPHRISVAERDALVASAKAASEDQRPRTFAGTGPDRPASPRRPDRDEGGVRGDPRDLLRHILELLQGGDVEKAVDLIRQLLGASDGPSEGDEVTAGKSLLDPKTKARLREAFRDLQSGPAALERARIAIRKDKEVLRFVDRAVRAPSPEKRLLHALDAVVKGDD